MANGRIIVTSDADSWMTPNTLTEVTRMLDSGKYIGWGVRIRPERLSLGILCSVMVVVPLVVWHRVASGGLFWFYKSDFDELGGFDEKRICVDDIDFAQRLKRLGKENSR